MNNYNWDIMKCQSMEIESNIRMVGFGLRFYSWLFMANIIKYFPKDFHPFISGLEMKFALESAEKVGAKVVLGGMELDQSSVDALKVQTSLNPLTLLWNARKATHNAFWKKEV